MSLPKDDCGHRATYDKGAWWGNPYASSVALYWPPLGKGSRDEWVGQTGTYFHEDRNNRQTDNDQDLDKSLGIGKGASRIPDGN